MAKKKSTIYPWTSSTFDWKPDISKRKKKKKARHKRFVQKKKINKKNKTDLKANKNVQKYMKEFLQVLSKIAYGDNYCC